MTQLVIVNKKKLLCSARYIVTLVKEQMIKNPRD